MTGFGFAAFIVGLIAFLESQSFSKYGNNVTGDLGMWSFFFLTCYYNNLIAVISLTPSPPLFTL